MPDYESDTAPWYNKEFKKVVIKDGVSSIGMWAFFYCSGLTSVTISNSVTSIGNYAFSYCENLTSIIIPNSVTNIGNNAFYKCSSLTSITIPNSVTSIGHDAFAFCKVLTSITIPNSVTSIGEKAFNYCSNLTAITVEKGNTKYDSRDNCNALIETNSNTLIMGCKNTVIPNSVTSIGHDAFSGCESLTSITIPNSVTSIEDWAFSNCIGLTSITIPNSVTSIGMGAFEKCRGLTSVTFARGTPPEFGIVIFKDVNNSITVYVPANSIEEYKNVLGGLGFSNIQANPKQLFLTDNDSYTRDSETDGIDVSYTRNFTNVNWQAIYLPFSLKYEDLKDDFELAYINTVRQYDKDNDGVIDKTEMEIIKIKSGSTVPNMPYLIRAKTTGEKTFSAEDATVSAAEERSVDCSTTIAKFTITGTYKPIPSETMIANNYYGMGGGKLIQSDGSNGLNPYRWYMKVESRDSRYNMSNAAKAITISVLDEEETTGIRELFASSPASQFQITNDELPVYDMNGRKVNENSLKPGIYVKNGKKFVVK